MTASATLTSSPPERTGTSRRAPSTQPRRRVSPRVYKLLLVTHIIVAVGWLGIVLGKLILGVAAARAEGAVRADALFTAMGVINVAFPPLAIGTLVTGVLLSLTTKWGLLRHYWIATKLTLTIALIATALQLNAQGSIVDVTAVPTSLLLSLTVAHLVMLVVATVVSVYKPWGRTRWRARQRTRPGYR